MAGSGVREDKMQRENPLPLSAKNLRDKAALAFHNSGSKQQRKPFNIRLWISSKWDQVQASLFFEPFMGVVCAIVLAICLTLIDKEYTGSDRVPTILKTTDDSARAILSTVAGATISFAGTAFSLSLLVFQMASTAYSPRITHTLFRDVYNRRVMGFNVGVFSYCLVIMRSVRLPGKDDELKIVVPNMSVALAMVLGILSILSIVAFIDHSAHSLDISELLHRVHAETVLVIQRDWPLPHIDDDEALENSSKYDQNLDKELKTEQHPDEKEESSEYHMVRFRESGWVQELNLLELEQLVPTGGHIKVLTTPGQHAMRGSAACQVFAPMDDDENKNETPDWEILDALVLDRIAIARNRTMRDDPSFGLRQTVDVILRALSPGINDPTTAQDGIFHAASLVLEFLTRDPPPSVIKTKNNGRLLLTKQQTHDKIVKLAYNEIRVCAASSPTVCLYLIESLRLIRSSLSSMGLGDRAPEIERQVQLIEGNFQKITSHVDADYEAVARTRVDGFPHVLPLGSSYKDAVLHNAPEN